MPKRILAVFLAALMLFAFAATASAAEKTYRVSSAKDLALIAKYPDATFTLTCDIDFQNAEWTPVGTQSKPFTGTINGNGREITNIKIKDAEVMGFLAYNSGTVKDLTLYNCTAEAKGAKIFGGIAAQNDGTIENCAIALASAKITAKKDAHIGQIAGFNNGTIAKTVCGVDMEVSAKENAAVGGVVAVNNGTLTESEGSGRIIASEKCKVGLICAYAKADSVCDTCYYTGNMAKCGGEVVKKMTVSANAHACVKNCLWRDNSNSAELLDEEEYDRRRKTTDYFNMLASFVWVPSKDVEIDYTDPSNSSGQYSKHFYEGQIYYGMTYGPRGKNMGSLLDGFDENGEFKDYVKDGPNGWDLYNSGDCSSTVTNCWQVVSPSVRATNTSNFMPGFVSPAFGPNNVIQVGKYTISDKAKSTNKTADVYDCNYESTMAEALVSCLPGDATNSTTKGHVRMVMEVKAMRDEKGKLDYDQSALICNGMGDGLSRYHQDICAYYPYSVRELLEQEYIPVTIREFKKGAPEVKLELCDCKTLSRNTICQGTVSTNYGILNCKLEILDEGGKPYWSHTLWERVYNYTVYGSDSNDMGRRTYTSFDLSRFATSLAEANLKTGKKYTVRLTTLLSNLETYEVKNYSFVY